MFIDDKVTLFVIAEIGWNQMLGSHLLRSLNVGVGLVRITNYRLYSAFHLSTFHYAKI